jgi:hypothetical protein
MRRVIIESPYAGDVQKNKRYLRACLRDCISRGEAPYASHGLYTQPGVLRDDVPEERTAGINAGFAWRTAATATVVYENLGRSKGMDYGIEDSIRNGVPVEYRLLPESWDDVLFDDQEALVAQLLLDEANIAIEHLEAEVKDLANELVQEKANWKDA